MVIEGWLGEGCWVWLLVGWVREVAFGVWGCADGFVCDGPGLMLEGRRLAYRCL